MATRRSSSKRGSKRDPKSPDHARAKGVEAADVAAVYLPPSELVPWSGNPNKGDVAAAMRSIKRFARRGDGEPTIADMEDHFGSPIVARLENREIIAGHTRWEAASRLGLTRVPVRLLDISEEDAHKLCRADNQIARRAKIDRKKLVEQLIEDYDAGGIDDIINQGWDQDYMDKLLGGSAVVEEIDLGDVADEFWLSVRGPLQGQADALEALKRTLEAIPGATVELGTTEF